MTDLVSTIDHLVIVAATLEQGAACVEGMLGIRPAKGGAHVKMGTHNCVLPLGDSVYLEVIAVNPAASAPSQRRWFGMDDPIQHSRVQAGPYLATFVARTTNIDACAAAVPAIGPVHEMARGPLQWRISIPEDGILIENGGMPAFIQWPEGVHPCQTMPPSSCTLLGFEVRHPQPRHLDALWQRAGLRQDERLTIRQSGVDLSPGLAARVLTPNGVKILR